MNTCFANECPDRRRSPKPVWLSRHLAQRLKVIQLLLTAASPLIAAPDFTRDVQPIFAAHCVKCHGPEEQNGGLRYDQKARALAQADSGHHAIVPGKADQSELLRRITSTHKNDQMPPKGTRLSPQQIETLTAWIAAGAEWPETAAPVAETAVLSGSAFS